MLILLPPSEGKTVPRRGSPLDLAALSFPELSGARAEMLDALVRCCAEDPVGAARALGLGPSQADLVRRNAELHGAPTARADRVYSGVLYDALALGDLDAAARRRAANRLLVTSALFGVVRPTDRIPAYRLSGQTKLPGVGGVAAYWSKRLGPLLGRAAGRGLVVDLRSSTYAGFWRPTVAESARVVGVRVLHEVDGRRQVVSHFNKATKGRLVRALLVDGRQPKDPAGFADLLRDLGWDCELTRAAGKPPALDVVVREL